MLEMQRHLKILENVLGKPASREWFAIAWTTLTRFNHSSFFRLILIIIVTMIIILIMIYQCNGDDGGIFYWPRFNGGPQFCQFSHRIFLEVSFAARSKVEPEDSVHRLNNTSGIRICTVVNLFLTLFFLAGKFLTFFQLDLTSWKEKPLRPQQHSGQDILLKNPDLEVLFLLPLFP